MYPVITIILIEVLFLLSIHSTSYKKQVVYALGLFVFSCFLAGMAHGADMETEVVLALIIMLVLFLAAVYMAGKVIRSKKSAGEKKDEPECFRNKKVLVFVPHEDDEVNLVGGVIERYVSGGSEAFLCFSTNGDKGGFGQRRMKEAIECAGLYGIPEDHVIFLGYGDQWEGENRHVITSNEDEVLRSCAGKTKTYGLSEHPSYIEGEDYTRKNFIGAIKKLIIELRPDIIFCIDYDVHSDHRALSIGFEEAMCGVLRETDLRPEVYKGFAYSTAFNAAHDFYGKTLKKTEKPDKKPFMTENNIYLWENRVSVPVSDRSAERFLTNNLTYAAWRAHESQMEYHDNIFGVINADKVFFERRTDSLLYNAKISASSGDCSYLNDFKMIDPTDVFTEPFFVNRLWIPDRQDTDRKITVRLKNPAQIGYIKLYDNPSVRNNILGCVIELFGENEEVLKKIEVSGLMENGSETVVKTGITDRISAFTVQITESEGERAGLTEIEAFSGDKTASLRGLPERNDEGCSGIAAFFDRLYVTSNLKSQISYYRMMALKLGRNLTKRK